MHARAPVLGKWDRLGLEQALTNVLTNGGKYAPEKPIDVTVESSGTNASLSVRDEGPGIPVE
ncbi:ATP-binding protein, partial [Acinetobacter baumannii]